MQRTSTSSWYCLKYVPTSSFLLMFLSPPPTHQIILFTRNIYFWVKKFSVFALSQFNISIKNLWNRHLTLFMVNHIRTLSPFELTLKWIFFRWKRLTGNLKLMSQKNLTAEILQPCLNSFRSVSLQPFQLSNKFPFC